VTKVSEGNKLVAISGIAVEANGSIVVSDARNGVIRINPVTGTQTTISQGQHLAASRRPSRASHPLTVGGSREESRGQVEMCRRNSGAEPAPAAELDGEDGGARLAVEVVTEELRPKPPVATATTTRTSRP
jgi:hypothetical protein